MLYVLGGCEGEPSYFLVWCPVLYKQTFIGLSTQALELKADGALQNSGTKGWDAEFQTLFSLLQTVA